MEREFAERDRRLAELAGLQEVTLCFEHDLYDQLQLIQVLERLSRRPSRVSVTLACEAEYLGDMPPERLRVLFEARRSVSLEQEDLAARAWAAFTAADREALPAFLEGDSSALRFLAPALRRLLEEYPSPEDGLSRCERQALEALDQGASAAGEVYTRSHHDREEAIFLGDTVFSWYLERLSRVRAPLLTLASGQPVGAPRAGDDALAFWRQSLVLTDAGRAVLAGEVSHADLNGVDRWIGGVHLVIGAA